MKVYHTIRYHSSNLTNPLRIDYHEFVFDKIREYINTHGKKRILTFVIGIAILASLALTVIIAQQQQTIRQRASETISSPFPTQTDDTLGEQRVATILVNFKDDISQPWTPEFIRGVIFDNVDSVNAYYKEVSYDKVFLKGDVFGWYTLPLESKVCNSTAEIEKSVLHNANINLNYRNFDRIIIMFPRSKFCDDWDGTGNVGKIEHSTKDGVLKLSIAHINGRANLGTIGHELAHNFGLEHANLYNCRPKIVEGNCFILLEGDPLSITNAGWTFHPNASQKEYLKWLDKSTVQEVTTKDTYTILPIESKETGIKALKIPVSLADDGSVREWYFLEYRQPIGFDRVTDAGFYSDLFGGLIIHYNPSKTTLGGSLVLDMTPETVSGFDNALRIGKTFVDPFGGTSFSVTSSTETKIEVNVNPTTKNCAATSPIINVEPTTQKGRPGETLIYNLIVKNQDNCKQHIFALSLGSEVGWGVKFDRRLVVAPEATSKAIISITSPTTANEGTYDFYVIVEGIDKKQFGSFKGTYIIPTPTPTIKPSPTPTPAPNLCTVCSADINKDGTVNYQDLSISNSCNNKVISGACLNADANKDGRIDTLDTSCVGKNFGKKCLQPTPTPTPIAVGINSGLIAYLKLDGNANDSSVNGNNGTVTGAIPTADRNGQENKAYSFDGANDKIIINKQLVSNYPFTFTAWTTFGDDGDGEIVGLYSGTNNNIQFQVGQDGRYFNMRARNPIVSTIFSTGQYPLNTWHHVASVYHSATKTELYVDGVLQGIGNASVPFPSSINRMVIGANQSTSQDYNGKIDEVRIYNRALSSDVIKALYQTNTFTADSCTVCGADINKDKVVNIQDTTVINSCLNKPITGTCANADVDKSGTIDVVDLNCAFKNFLKRCP